MMLLSDPAGTQHVCDLVEQIRPILSGHPPETQGAVLADLLAMFLAGYRGKDAPAIRDQILVLHINTVLALIPVNEQIMRENTH